MKCPDCGREVLIATSNETGREVWIEPKGPACWRTTSMRPLSVTPAWNVYVEHVCGREEVRE